MAPRGVLHANKRLGQHFLVDPNIVRKIIAAARLGSAETVLEIGPGRGALTGALSEVAGRVVAVEIDPVLHRLLEERRVEWRNVELIQGDALTYPLGDLPPGTVVVANLPYYISTPLLFRLLAQRTRFPRMVLMLQDEVADRLVAGPGAPAYGVLSVMVQYAAEVTKAFRVSAQCFRPKPEVGSAVVLLRSKSTTGLSLEEERRFSALVKAAFAHRRKMLLNSLRDEGYDGDRMSEALSRLNLPTTVRAERLSPEQFVELTRLLSGPPQETRPAEAKEGHDR
ncbi:MAG TPA: 16S rRNA (adenine(1518)-N(6)/adenine(1519)-N(6))-dimethyltransferase RsmA [Nitrospira sp.]|nr:16S rRNA (adenine(1518)-N(6)/adenine(1519)-N(6))-dimethyltransferase RsmA [Nitrospira sp.]